MMEVVVTAGAISRAKLQSDRRTINKPTSNFFTGRMPFLSPNQQCQSIDALLHCLFPRISSASRFYPNFDDMSHSIPGDFN